MRNFKLPIAVGVFVAVILIGVAARSVYYQSRVLDPLTHLASELPGVESVRIAESIDGRNDVYVQFGPDAQLEIVYPEVEALARATFGSSFGRVIALDRRTPELSTAFYDVHFLVQEGISTGQFSRMASALQSRLADLGVDDHRVYVGDRFVFVHLYDGDRYLFEVTPRLAPHARSAVMTQGGVAPW